MNQVERDEEVEVALSAASFVLLNRRTRDHKEWERLAGEALKLLDKARKMRAEKPLCSNCGREEWDVGVDVAGASPPFCASGFHLFGE